MRRFFLGMMLLGLFVGRTSPAQPNNPHLEVLWKSHLGPPESATYRTALCADGSAHVINSNGRVVSLDPAGRIAADRRHSALLGIFAVACADNGIYVFAAGRGAGPRLLRVARGENVEPVVVANAREPMLALTWAGPHGLLAVTPRSEGYISKVSRLGVIETRFGAPEAVLAQGVDARQLNGSHVLWDSKNRRLLFLPHSSLEIELFSEEGQFLDRRSPDRQVDTAEKPTKQEVVGAALLPGGTLVLQLLLYYPLGERGERNEAVFEVMDKDLRRVSASFPQPPNGAGLSGVLVGADAAGGLYFQSIRRNELAVGNVEILKAKLVEN